MVCLKYRSQKLELLIIYEWIYGDFSVAALCFHFLLLPPEVLQEWHKNHGIQSLHTVVKNKGLGKFGAAVLFLFIDINYQGF